MNIGNTNYNGAGEQMKKLYLFTASFPYDAPKESFLEDEIVYLAQKFKSVIVVPYGCGSFEMRAVPANCTVLPPVSKKNKALRRIFNCKTVFPFIYDFVINKVLFNKAKFKSFQIAYSNANILLNSEVIKKIAKEIRKEDVCYFYWGKGSNLLAYFWEGKAKMVSRFHGDWDLWEERYGGYAPLRKQIISSLDFAIHISKKGETYFKSKYPGCRTVLFPLGTRDFGICNKESEGLVLKVLSCSSVYPLKRVDLIFRSLNHCTQQRIHWTHIGSGVDFNKLKEMVARDCKDHLTVSLLGSKSHEEVMDYYQNNIIDVFINLSTMEGVPVSIMEAMSFNIPIIATDVGSTAEEVNNNTGVLLSANPTVDEVVNAIALVRQESFAPRQYWEEKYSADNNYGFFADFLFSL